MKYLVCLCFSFFFPAYIFAQASMISDSNDINQLLNIMNNNFTSSTNLFWNVTTNTINGSGLTANEKGQLETLSIIHGSLVGTLKVHDSEGLLSIDLSNNQLSGIDLQNSARLLEINLSANNITDDNIHFDGLYSLQELTLQHNLLKSANPLKKLTSLQRLRLNSNRLDDISALSSLKELQVLILSDNQIIDISSLSNLENLHDLQLNENKIRDIKPLSGLKNLETLFLTANHISDIDPLAGMDKLQTLALGENDISNISALAKLISLTNLDISHNKITEISAIEKLTNLTDLYLNNNKISDINPLSGLNKLDYLYLSDNKISDITPLLMLNLSYLSIDRNRVPLGQLAKLQAQINTVDMQEQDNVYFYKRLHLLNEAPTYRVSPEDAWILSAATAGTIDNRGARYQAAQKEGDAGYVFFDAPGEYILRLSNDNVSDYYGQVATNSGTFIVLDKKPKGVDTRDLSNGKNNAYELASSIGSIFSSIGKQLMQYGFIEAKNQEELAALEYFVDALKNDKSGVAPNEQVFVSQLLSQAPGEIHAGANDSLLRDLAKVFSLKLQTLNIDLNDPRQAPSSGDQDSHWRFNSKLYKGSGRLSADPSYQSSCLERQGNLFSLDRLSDHWRWGGAVAIDRFQQHWPLYAGKTDVNSIAAAIYGSYHWNSFSLGTQIHSGYADVSSRRVISVLNESPSAKYKQRWYGADIYASYTLAKNKLLLSPTIGLSWLKTRQSAFSEKWENDSYMKFDESKLKSLETRFSINIQRPAFFKSGLILRPYLNFGVAAEIGDRQTVLTSTWYNNPFAESISFKTKGPQNDRWRWNIAAGLEAELNANMSLIASFHRDFSKSYQFNQGEAAISFRW